MSDLWNNPMVNNALKAMSKEDLEKYKKIGEQLYGNINFQDSTVINQLTEPVEEAIAYVEEGLKSGLLPEDLEENEEYSLNHVSENEILVPTDIKTAYWQWKEGNGTYQQYVKAAGGVKNAKKYRTLIEN